MRSSEASWPFSADRMPGSEGGTVPISGGLPNRRPAELHHGSTRPILATTWRLAPPDLSSGFCCCRWWFALPAWRRRTSSHVDDGDCVIYGWRSSSASWRIIPPEPVRLVSRVLGVPISMQPSPLTRRLDLVRHLRIAPSSLAGDRRRALHRTVRCRAPRPSGEMRGCECTCERSAR